MRIPPLERVLAMLGYLPFFFWWIPIVARRDSMFCQFHGRQAGVLWGLWLAPSVVIFLVMLFMPTGLQQSLSPWFFGGAAVLLFIYLGMSLVGFVKAGIRERYRMPVVADVALMLRL